MNTLTSTQHKKNHCAVTALGRARFTIDWFLNGTPRPIDDDIAKPFGKGAIPC